MTERFRDNTRSTCLASVRDRLTRAIDTGDASAVAGPEARAEAEQLARFLTEDPDDHQVRHALGWLHYTRYLALPAHKEELESAVAAFVTLLLLGIGTNTLPTPLLPDLTDLASIYSHELTQQALSSDDPALLTASIQGARSVADATPADDPQRAGRLTTLVGALHARYTRTGHDNDLDAAVEAARALAEAPPPADPLNQAIALNTLGVVLCGQFARSGGKADLDDGIASFQAAVNAVPIEHPEHGRFLFNLGGALRSRYELIGTTDDLDRAIDVLQTAVDAVPADHPDRATGLNNLGNALRSRFECGRNSQDIDLAVVAGRLAVAETPTPHVQRAARLSTLAVTLETRYGRVGNSEDLDEAVTVGRLAVASTPSGHPDRARRLNNLANALRVRYHKTGNGTDLDEAISSLGTAVEVTPRGFAGLPAYQSNSGAALRLRYRHKGAVSDLNDAITALGAAAEATRADHSQRVGCLVNLGNALRDRLEATGDEGDLSAAATAFAQASQLASAPPSRRIDAARSAARLLASSAPGQAADLLEAAIRLLPEVAPRHLKRGDQQYVLAELAGVASDAAALALIAPGGTQEHRAARALRLMEAGRAVLISQALEARSDLTELRQQYPGLAASFVELRSVLDQQVDASGEPEEAPKTPEAWRDAGTEHRDRLAREFADTVHEIRAIPKFASFGLPPTTAELLAEADQGPVVVFTTSDQGSAALLLTADDGITAVELPRLEAQTLRKKTVDFHQALHTAMRGGNKTSRRKAQAVLSSTLEWLWDTAAAPVLDSLGFVQAVGEEAAWPRVWWVPSGPLNLLPLHAAGYHTDPPDSPQRRTVMDRVVSSYTPTVRALRHARRQTAQPSADVPALVVAMPTTPGLPHEGRLTFVEAEVAVVRRHLPNTVLLSEPDAPAPGPSSSTRARASAHTTTAHEADTAPTLPPTRDRVLQHLPHCPIAHFSCHGATNHADPSQSLLLLHDHADNPLTVASLAPVDLKRAQLVYLSACSTATVRTVDLLDEAIHLTTAFQLAGFPQVIGTLWEINDQASVIVAEAFYSQLCVSPDMLDTRRAATALHAAIRTMRDALPLTPSLWAAYIHAGA
ncbi:CHAT domain-containing protein [Streptomyces sp. MS2.AVA.5]|uniref:CHAT domain-containing protein n=1 Tax=Streptomyces achmelvichensis TaxID=3134111 RepID=A0ACC6Q8A8_9ACTN